jgi:hypothetical protein
VSNPWDDMRAAVNAAKDTMRAADSVADSLADVLDGRLRHVTPWRLKKLKRQLQDFDANRGLWKDQRA